PRHERLIGLPLLRLRRLRCGWLRWGSSCASYREGRFVSETLEERRLSGDVVAPLPPGLYPARIPLDGRYARVEPLHPIDHAQELWDASHDGPKDVTDRIWDYLPYGPFPSFDTFRAWLRTCSASADPTFFAIRDGRTGKAAGMASYLNIRPSDGVIEI